MIEDSGRASQAFSRTDQSFLGSWWWTVDRAMLGGILVLVTFGVALVATASPSVAQKIDVSDYHFLVRHIVFLVPCLALMIGLSFCSPRTIWRASSVALLCGALAMVAVLVTGTEIKGARRWLDIAGFSLQPSEFVKPAFAIVAAWLIAKHEYSSQHVGARGSAHRFRFRFMPAKGSFPGYHLAVGLYAVFLALLLLQPDLGMTVVLTAVFGAQIFLAGMRFRYLAGMLGLGVAGLGMAYIGFGHVRSRIDRFLYPESGDNYQVERSLDAIKNGGFFGTGPGQGTEKLGLPDAHADFISSVLAEEMGVLSLTIMMAIFLFIILRGFSRLKDNGDMFSILAVGGLLTMFGLQALIHLGSSVNILPAKGMTLPFISYGGSSMIAMGMSMGMVLSLTRRRNRTSIARLGMSMKKAPENVREAA